AVDVDITPPAVAALTEATREALRNVRKHAETRSVVVRCETSDAGVRVTVRDHGVGFDVERVFGGFGTDQSVRGRMADVGGTTAAGTRCWPLSRPVRGATCPSTPR